MKKFIFVLLIILLPGSVFAEKATREIAKKWDAVTVAVDTDWFASDLGPSVQNQGPVKHTFEFSCPTATVINLQKKFNSITKVFTFNKGVAIGANEGNNFSTTLHRGMTYNIQHKTGTQACAVIISESFNVDL